MLAGVDGGQRVADADGGVARHFDDDFDLGAVDQRHGVVGNVGFTGFQGIGERGCVDLFLWPLHALQPVAGAGGHQIGEADEMHARRHPALSEEHGAEFTGTDLADAHGLVLRLAVAQHGR